MNLTEEILKCTSEGITVEFHKSFKNSVRVRLQIYIGDTPHSIDSMLSREEMGQSNIGPEAILCRKIKLMSGELNRIREGKSE